MISHRRGHIAFRILDLRKDQLSNLETCLFGHKVKSKEYKGTGTFIVALDLLPDSNYDALYDFLVRNSIPEDSYGLWIGLTTTNYIDEVEVPDYVRKFYKRTGGNIDFSFVFVSPEDE